MNSDKTTVVDPVCGMDIEPSSAAGAIVYDGRTYHFCSTHCKAAFASAPLEYAPSTLMTEKASSCCSTPHVSECCPSSSCCA